MTRYHCDDYIKFLKTIRPDNTAEHQKLMQRCECVCVIVSMCCVYVVGGDKEISGPWIHEMWKLAINTLFLNIYKIQFFHEHYPYDS